MLSPAQRHMMRVSAEKASSQRVNDPLRSALPYGQMLMKLRGDRQILKSIYSVEDKARRKRDMLPAYAPWIAGVLASDAGNQDDVLMTMLQWSLDAGDIRGTFDMARYALKHGLSVPNNKRPTPYLFAEDVALAAMRARSAGQAVSVDDLLTVIDMTLPHDMPDPVSVQRQRQALSEAGISTRSLSESERRLKSSISETTAQLNRQRDSLARVSAQQARLNAVRQRYQSGKQLAGSVTAAGARGVGVAAAGTVAGGAALKPGYDFSLKNSELQAVLGLEKDSADMLSLRKQARQLGDNTAASADDAAAAQIIVAKSGADKDGILAATPTILNLSLANRQSMEDNASLLMGVKSAFGLANDKVAHIGDVLSTTMNKSAADFAGMSDALTYAAPVAKNAGVSVEQTAAMVGALADAKITGSMAGTGSRALITRLQAPTGAAATALDELGVKTADRKGDFRPIFTILKEMQKSFKKNNLGTAQKAQYMKAIFGEEASSAAAVLMNDASSGKLDALTQALRTSDGKTAELVEIMQNNLGGDFKEFQSAYEAVGTDIYDQQEASLRSLTQTATKYVLRLDKWIVDNKALATTLAKIAGGAVMLVGALGVIGLIAGPVIGGINMIVAAATGLWSALSIAGGAIATVIGGLTWPIVAIGVAIVAGALLIRKYWEPISAFFSGVIEGLGIAFEPVKEMFAPLKPVFEWLGDKLKIVWQWFKDLIQPVKSTKETLDSCKDAGVPSAGLSAS